MTHTLYVVTDLGPGDGGKGGVVHKLATLPAVHTVIKWGGAQGSHGTRTSTGRSFAFSQWGCGSFDGIPTHISDQMVVSPEGLLNECVALAKAGVPHPVKLLTIDEDALCATDYHRIASRLKELARGNNPRGTIGTGVGEAYRDLTRHPDHAIFVRDLRAPDLRDKLAAVRDQVRAELATVLMGTFLADDEDELTQEVSLLYDDEFFEFVVGRYAEANQMFRIVGHEYLAEEILPQPGEAVVETSHGILTDNVYGFDPHTSAIRTLPSFKQRAFEEAGYDGEVVNLGVTRAYAIRHGAGPLPTNDPNMAEQLLPGSNKDANRYQGKVRVGPMDFVLLRYAIAVCGGPEAFDGLAITWFDQVQSNGAWHLCREYSGADDPDLFISPSEIRLVPEPSQERQQALTRQLFNCRGNISTFDIDPAASPEELFALCADVVEEELAVPVRMLSFGPTELEKLWK